MGTLYILNDLGTSMPWNFSLVFANRHLLSKNNIEIEPPVLTKDASFVSHGQYWNAIPAGKTAPDRIVGQVRAMFASLDADHDVLLLNPSVSLSGQRSFARLLEQEKGFSRHRVKAIFVVGRPICLFEQRWRWYGKNIKENNRIAFTRNFINMHGLIGEAFDLYGSPNTTLIADLSDTPKAVRQDGLAARIFSELGCPVPKPLNMLPKNPLIFGSVTGRRLESAREVRNNAWPDLDSAAYRSCLLAMDEQWENEPVSPLALRVFLNEEGQKGRASLEGLLGLEKCALSAPEWLAGDAAACPDAPLDMEKIRNFAAALPEDVASPLMERLGNDSTLLSGDQKMLLNALEASHQGSCRRIGEPEEPVSLTVLTMAYNQEKYIAECMDSVLAQKTDFPVRHLVLDHASADATPRIVADYARKHPSITPVLLSRHAAEENVRGLFMRCRTKYAALCDGDDYFTDPLKLKLQAEFLEANTECGLVFHPVKVVFEDGTSPFIYPPDTQLPRGVKKEYHLLDLVRNNFIQTNSVVYRWRFAEGLPDWFRSDICPGDWYWHLLHAEKGRIGFIHKVMSIYRRHGSSLYVNSFKNVREHRRQQGMRELMALEAVNDHFDNRYFSQLASLANGVFVNFLEISIEENDKSFLDNACEAYPKFGTYFLNSLKLIGADKNNA